jgi:hypothetical protein
MSSWEAELGGVVERLCISRLDGFSGSERAYMCEKDAAGQGIRAAKNEKHPA